MKIARLERSLSYNDYSYTHERMNSKANVFLIISFIQIASFTQVLNKFQIQRLESSSFLNEITHALKSCDKDYAK